jgi:CRISPR-associated endonuclease/helicase Cas3
MERICLADIRTSYRSEAHSSASQKFSYFLKENNSARQLIASAWSDLQQYFTIETPSFKISDDTRREMHVRMVFSAPVDADYLATEKHFDQSRTNIRGKWPELTELWERF